MFSPLKSHIWSSEAAGGGHEKTVTYLGYTVLLTMKLFKNSSLASNNVFLYHFSFFSRPIALLCGSQKASIDTKIISL